MRGSSTETDQILFGRQGAVTRDRSHKREIEDDQQRLTEHYDLDGKLYLIELHRGGHWLEFEHNAPAADDEDRFGTGRADGAFYTAPALIYLEDGKPHRQGGPAVICDNRQEWWDHGERHRQDAPAIIFDNGDEEWFLGGRLHRDSKDGPAITYHGPYEDAPMPQEQFWFENGRRHRDEGPAHVLSTISKSSALVIDGEVAIPERWNEPETYEGWYQHGSLHRDHGPAVSTSYGLCEYYRRGRHHRLDGPAVCNDKYPGREQYWIDGQKLDEDQWKQSR